MKENYINYLDYGCYWDDPNNRTIMNSKFAKISDLTIIKCILECFNNSYAYSGVENGLA